MYISTELALSAYLLAWLPSSNYCGFYNVRYVVAHASRHNGNLKQIFDAAATC